MKLAHIIKRLFILFSQSYHQVKIALFFFIHKGYLLMTDEWFSEFVYEVVIDKKFVSEEVLDVFQQDPVVLPAWDPMGSLA